MRVLYQPTQDTPGDWQEVDSRDWKNLPSMNAHALCVQGLVFEGADKYAVRNLPSGGIKVFVWHDDPDDWPAGQRWARVVTVPLLGADPDLGGAINVLATHVIYAEGGIRPAFDAAYATNPKVTVRDWSDFVPPQARTLEGAWVTDEAHMAHCMCRTPRGWREWTDGLAPELVDEHGCVIQQRVNVNHLPPDGTRTYYVDPTAGPILETADFNDSALLSPTGSTNQSSGVNQAGSTVLTAVTPAGEPDSAAWPTTGVYRYQIDIISAGADLTYGLLSQGGNPGYFGRVNAAGTTALQTIAQDQAAFVGAGLNIASITNPAWTAGADTDRFGIALASVRIAGHGGQTLTMQTGELDDFTDGPWPAAVVATENAAFFGMNF